MKFEKIPDFSGSFFKALVMYFHIYQWITGWLFRVSYR